MALPEGYNIVAGYETTGSATDAPDQPSRIVLPKVTKCQSVLCILILSAFQNYKRGKPEKTQIFQ